MVDDITRSTREKVLEILSRKNRCTIIELAKAVDINPISVRHHIVRLQADGFVSSEEEKHGVGRPRRVYFLTEAGVERFPTRYLKLTQRLLAQLKENLPASMVNKLFSEIATDLAKDYARAAKTKSLSMEQRLQLMKDLLTNEGFSVEWEQRGDSYFISEVTCPYFRIGQNHPEVCWVDQTLISIVLDVPAEKVKCVLDGDSHCAYIVPVTNEQYPTGSN